MNRFLVTILLVCSAFFFSYGQNSNINKLHLKNAKLAPMWITHGIIYQVQPRAFTRAGTLRAATDSLYKVAELGASIVYLCPVFVMDTDTNHATWSPRQIASGMDNPRNPYRISDYFHVDPEFGSDINLKEFIDEAHKLGLKVMLDLVYLHCGSNAIFLKRHPNYVQHTKGGQIITTKWHWPKLNFENPALREYLYVNMAYWIVLYHVDGFRCDVADGIPLSFWESVRKRLEVLDPDIGMLAEGERPEDQLKAFDLNYGFTWFNALSKVFDSNASVSILRHTWEGLTSVRPKGTRFILFSDTHDIANDAWYNGIERRWGFKGVNAAFVLNFTMPGVPFIYNGQEVADKARNSIFGDLPVDWSLGNTPEGQRRFAFLQKLIKVHKNEVAITNGTLRWINNTSSDEVISFERSYKNEHIVIIVNLENQKINVRLKGADNIVNKTFTSLIEDKGISGNIRNGLELPAYGYWVGVMKD